MVYWETWRPLFWNDSKKGVNPSSMMVITAAVAALAGLAAGFFIGVYVVRKQMEKWQQDPKRIQDMAKKMGISLNRQQMNQARKMLKNKTFR